MKMTEMIHKTVVAFGPERHPIYALMALAMMLTALVLICTAGGEGLAAFFRAML